MATYKQTIRHNPWGQLATHVVSIGYNTLMLYNYNYQLAMAQAMRSDYMSAEQIQAMKKERIKHTVLLSLECIGLIVTGICSLQAHRQAGAQGGG